VVLFYKNNIISTHKNDVMKQLRVLMAIFPLLVSLSPLHALTGKDQEQQNYCKGWATRFLTLKNGTNYTMELHGKYVDICLEHYAELRNYYKTLNQAN
tara:strand:+ start:203 stop:496 length:294 start_codon:yes stop_codon:yes gene_type:complete